ncbi:winged helix-turn-helix transcriptional regulator [Pedobacter sp. L105]
MISYNLTDYASSLKPIITALKDWGKNHKNVLFRDKPGV